MIAPTCVNAKKEYPGWGIPFLVPLTGLEPVRSRPQRILSPRCLPFHHSGVDYRTILAQFSGAVKGENPGSLVGAIQESPAVVSSTTSFRKKDRVKITTSLRGGQSPTHPRVASLALRAIHLLAIRSLSVPAEGLGGALHRRGCGLPRRFAPRNDVVTWEWSF